MLNKGTGYLRSYKYTFPSLLPAAKLKPSGLNWIAVTSEKLIYHYRYS